MTQAGLSGFKDRLADARGEHGRHRIRWTNEAIGRAIGVTGVSVGEWLNGKNRPRPELVAALAELFEVDPGWLLFGGPTTRMPQTSELEMPALHIRRAEQLRAGGNPPATASGRKSGGRGKRGG